MSSNWSGPTPSFKRPPVNEVVLGVIFPELTALKTAHVGALWALFRDQYPSLEDHPPIVAPSESGDVRIELSDIPPLRRSLFISPNGSSLIQVQPDRLHQNWRKSAPDEQYPRYAATRDRFFKSLSLFRKFIGENSLGDVSPRRCEASYINHLPAGELWKIPSDITNTVLAFGGPFAGKDSPLHRPDTMSFAARFPLIDKKSNLHVSLKHGRRKADNAEAFVFELTVNGEPKAPDDQSLSEWFDFAHETIVRSFTEFTSPSAHKIWERER